MIGRRVATLLVAGFTAACGEAPAPIAPVAQSGELVVLTLNGPVTYFEDAQGLPSGFEYDRVQRQGRAHVAAAGLARHFDYPGGLAWGPPYLTTQHQVVGRPGTGPRPK